MHALSLSLSPSIDAECNTHSRFSGVASGAGYKRLVERVSQARHLQEQTEGWKEELLVLVCVPPNSVASAFPSASITEPTLKCCETRNSQRETHDAKRKTTASGLPFLSLVIPTRKLARSNI